MNINALNQIFRVRINLEDNLLKTRTVLPETGLTILLDKVRNCNAQRGCAVLLELPRLNRDQCYATRTCDKYANRGYLSVYIALNKYV